MIARQFVVAIKWLSVSKICAVFMALQANVGNCDGPAEVLWCVNGFVIAFRHRVTGAIL